MQSKWCVCESPSCDYITDCFILQYLASYYTNREPKGGKPAKKAKAAMPKKLKAKYSAADVIKVMFSTRIQAETERLWSEEQRKKQKFTYSRKALKKVEDGLTSKEALKVAKTMAAWEKGQGMTEDQKRL